MGRVPRVYIEGILYYVTSSSGYNENIFLDPADYDEYITLVANYKNQYGFKIFSYVLLPNHLHMLIELKNNVGISNIMHDINSRYTKAFNSRYGKKGHLFQERFRTLFAEKEPYLLPLARYIHLNPKRLKLVDEIKDYPYSSYAQFLDPARSMYPDMRGEIEEVFNALKGREKVFEEYVKSATAKDIADFKKLLHKKRILGAKAFAERVEKAIESAVREQKKAPQPTRMQIIYMALSGVAILMLVITLGYSYKSRVNLKSEYNKTLALYDTTLNMLKAEQTRAGAEGQPADEYAWKIELAENAREELKQERIAIDGYAWDIEIKQTEPISPIVYKDTISFANNQISSLTLGREGFSASNYSHSVMDNGNVILETIQRNDKGETANWRGEWDGNVMKGVLRKRSASGATSDFSFKSTGERMKR